MKNAEIYIIQTNVLIDKNNNPRDFQSYMYGFDKSWDEFKQYLLVKENEDNNKIIKGTMIGDIKPKWFNIENILINDDCHFEIIMNDPRGGKTNSKYYLVTKKKFQGLL